MSPSQLKRFTTIDEVHSVGEYLALVVLRDRRMTRKAAANYESYLELALTALLFSPKSSRLGVESFVLKIKHYPHWSVVASVNLATHPAVYTTVHEPLRHLR